MMEDPLPLGELSSLFEVEPGYGSVTGDLELGPAVRALEYTRAKICAASYGLAAEPTLRRVIGDTVVITTSGATGGVNTALSAALARDREGGEPYRREIVFNVPNYCLPDAFARLHGLLAHPIAGTRETGFLPSLEDVRRACGPSTLACMLTYPTNPAQTSWGLAHVAAWRSLIEHCQDQGIFLVVDTIFQDLQWGPYPLLEIFALARSPRFLCKVYSPSKDRPFACGYRIGYLIADRELEPWAERVESLVNNSCNTLSQVWLAFDVVFRRALLEDGLSCAAFEPLEDSYVFGYGAHQPDAIELHARVVQAGLYQRYAARVRQFLATIDDGLEQIWRWLRGSLYFEVDPRPPYGNTLMVKVRPPFDAGGEDAYFLDTLIATNVASLVGGCFGLDTGGDVWFRIVMAGAPPKEVIAAMERVQVFLIERAKQRKAAMSAGGHYADG